MGEMADGRPTTATTQPSVTSSPSVTTDRGEVTSSSSDVDIEKQRPSTADDDVIADHHVDIQYAEQQFADLKRRYSNLSRVTSGNSDRRRRLDAEKGHATREEVFGEEESDTVFDLEDYLRDRHRKELEHDIKPKHLGMNTMKVSHARRHFRRLDRARIRWSKVHYQNLSRCNCQFLQSLGNFQKSLRKEKRC